MSTHEIGSHKLFPMSFAEINLFGIYVAPIAPMMGAAWVMLVVLRRTADRAGLLAHVWHPSLFVFAVYIILLSATVLLVAGISG